MFTVPVCLSPVSSLSIQMCVKILAHLAIFNGMFIELSGCLMNCKHIWRHPTNKRIYPHVVRFVHTYMNTWVFALAYVLQIRNSGAKWKHQGGQSTIDNIAQLRQSWKLLQKFAGIHRRHIEGASGFSHSIFSLITHKCTWIKWN